jgi:hypothetical protein
MSICVEKGTKESETMSHRKTAWARLLTEFEKARQHLLYAKGQKLGDDCCAASVQV